jgi:hypothetical protein
MEACLAKATASRIVAGYFVATTLISPKLLESVRRQRRADRCRCDRPVTQPSLNRPRAVTLVGKGGEGDIAQTDQRQSALRPASVIITRSTSIVC